MFLIQFRLFFCISIFCFGCHTADADKKTPDLSSARNSLLQTDKAFSAMSAEKGMKDAYIKFMDDDGVLLRPNYMPLIGAEAIDYLLKVKDTSYTITWQPRHAVVAASADLGYTFGTYVLEPHYLDTVFYGNYVSIWKKQNDSSWKFVMESANEGLSKSANLP